MASGLRNKAEALALAGCDFLVVGPKVLTALDSAATLDGYNTGLSAAEEVPGSVERALSPQLAQEAEFSLVELETVDGELGLGLVGWDWERGARRACRFCLPGWQAAARVDLPTRRQQLARSCCLAPLAPLLARTILRLMPFCLPPWPLPACRGAV
jgi:hypothetical protein